MTERATLEFRQVIGRGGFGTVYRATLRHGQGFQKDVAVKVLHDIWVKDPTIAPRLRDEARVLGLLRHRALPSVDGLFFVDGQPALVTEYVEGATLLQLAHQGQLPVGVAIEAVAEVAGALHAAYSREGPDGRPLKMLHRDVKPANVQVTPAGEVKLLDFGVARADYSARESDTSGQLLGSLRYMSPERLDLRDGPGADVYSLGVLLLEISTGVHFKKSSAERERHEEFRTAVAKVLEQTDGDPRPWVLAPLLMRMLAYDPEERPTAREVERLCRELRRDLGGPMLADWAEAAVAAARLDVEVPSEPSEVKFLGRTLPAQIKGVTAEPVPRSVAPSLSMSTAIRGATVALVLACVVLGGAIALLAVVLSMQGRDVLTSAEPVPAAVEPAVPDGAVPDPASEAVPEPAPQVAPEVAPEPQPEVAPEPGPKPAPAPGKPRPARSGGAPVSAASFATFLASHPDWARDTAIERKRAAEGYLAGWVDGRPPPGAAHAVDVSWFAAQAYCGDRGGLAALDAAPLAWPEGSGPFQEWRAAAEGTGAWRRFDGVTSEVVRRKDSNAFTGFRCAR